MKVSVIIPSYNHSKYLKQRIDSVLNQTFKDFELIIIDDCSTDNSRDIINDYTSRFPDIESFFNTVNSGIPFIQWDEGVKKAKGEYIWIAESDDFACQSFLEKTTAIMDKNDNLGIVYCDSKVINELNDSQYLVSDKRRFFKKSEWENNYTREGKCEIYNHLFLANILNNVSALIFRKNKYIDAGLAGGSMKFCGDWFLYLRVLMISDIAYIAEPLNNYRLHSGSAFSKYYEDNTYLSEVKKIYSYELKNIRLSPVKRSLIALSLLRISCKWNIHALRRKIRQFILSG